MGGSPRLVEQRNKGIPRHVTGQMAEGTLAARPDLVVDRVSVTTDDKQRLGASGNPFGGPLGDGQVAVERMGEVDDHELVIIVSDPIKLVPFGRRVADRPSSEFCCSLEAATHGRRR